MASSTLQQNRNDMNMFSLYRIPPNSNKRRQNISNREYDFERLQVTSNDLKRPQINSGDINETVKKVKLKNKWKGGNTNGVNPINGRDHFEQTISSQ